MLSTIKPLEPLPVRSVRAPWSSAAASPAFRRPLELADAGHHVYLVEREPSIGGHMAQLDKTFPTLDCSACILTPKMVDVGQHPNITLLPTARSRRSRVHLGDFTVTVRKKARYVNEDVCTGCGICIEKCPFSVIDDEFDGGMGKRKVIYRPFPQAVPKYPVIDTENCVYFQRGKCKACQIFCPTEPKSIDFEQRDELIQINVGNIILATGYDLFDSRRIPQYGYGRLANVFTSLEFERMVNASGPTSGQSRHAGHGIARLRASPSCTASVPAIRITTNTARKSVACTR